VVSAAAGALGALPGAGGALDPVTMLGWMALAAPAAGAACGARGLGAPALLVPAAWALALALLSARHGRDLPAPLWAACAVGGLFALGHALGARSRTPLATAGALLFLGLVLATAAPGFGLLAGGTELARTHPSLAARLLDVSPLVLVFDCAGWDWTHAQPEVYAAAGVEWFQRRAYPGNLAGPAVLVVGCALAILARVSGARPDRPR
jgi:hypothetical protein